MSFKEWGASKSWSFADNRIRVMLQELYAGLLDTLKIGSDTNYLEIDENGDMFLRGDTTVWDDLTGSLVANKLLSVAGGLYYDWDENTIGMKPSGLITDPDDRLIFNFQVPHAAKQDSSMHLHVHWEQPDASIRTYTIQYRIQKNGQAKTTDWTTVITNTGGSSDAFTYVSGTLNQITGLAEVDITGAGISATIQFRMARTDAVAGDIQATFVDVHVEKDTMGSRQEYVK